MKNLEKFPLVKDYLTYRVRTSKKNIAIHHLRAIESYKGKTAKELIRKSDEYAQEVLGWKGYAPWLWVYCAVTGTFKEGWIPDSYYGNVVVPVLKGYYGNIGDLKSLASTVFDGSCFPDIAYFTNGLFLSKERTCLSEETLEEYLFRGGDQIVFKLDYSGRGQGIFFFTRSSFDIRKIRSMGNGVFQSYIDQHPYFDEFVSGSVSNIRITTVNDDKGEYSIRGCYLRMGREKDTHVKSSSHVRIPIDIENGDFYGQGYTTDWQVIEEHPDSKVRFSGKRVPEFAKCVSTVIDNHKRFPQLRSVGWDIIVDKDHHVRIMELNGTWNDICFTEATQGPSFTGLGWEELWKGNR